MKSTLSFDGHYAVVTGASGNLGSATAAAFLDAGAVVVMINKREPALEKIFPGRDDLSRAHVFGGVDLTSLDQVQAAAAQIHEQFERVDFLINIAGGYRAGDPVHETDVSTWEFMLELNARTVFNTAQSFLPAMRQRGSGKIVNVAARPGLRASAGSGAYAASKSAVLRLTEAMAAENKTSGINVNCIIPGTIDTPQNREAMPDADAEKWVQPDSLAGVILFLCTDMARDIHGAAIPVYGLT